MKQTSKEKAYLQLWRKTSLIYYMVIDKTIHTIFSLSHVNCLNNTLDSFINRYINETIRPFDPTKICRVKWP